MSLCLDLTWLDGHESCIYENIFNHKRQTCFWDILSNTSLFFVTQLYGGMWQITPRSSCALQTSVLQILRKARLLGKDDPGDRQEIFQAMKVFSRRRGLPPMETFNGIAFRILRDSLRFNDDGWRRWCRWYGWCLWFAGRHHGMSSTVASWPPAQTTWFVFSCIMPVWKESQCRWTNDGSYMFFKFPLVMFNTFCTFISFCFL